MGQQITLKELRQDARVRTLAYRSCQYAISKRGWDRVWPHLTPEEQDQIHFWMRQGFVGKIKTWIYDHPHLDLGEKSVERLRKMASDLGIKNYSRLSKHRLISAISKDLEVAT